MNDTLDVEEAIISKFKLLVTHGGIPIKSIYKTTDDELEIYHVFTEGYEIDLDWYKHFSEIEIELMNEYPEHKIDFRYLSERRMEERSISGRKIWGEKND